MCGLGIDAQILGGPKPSGNPHTEKHACPALIKGRVSTGVCASGCKYVYTYTHTHAHIHTYRDRRARVINRARHKWQICNQTNTGMCHVNGGDARVPSYTGVRLLAPTFSAEVAGAAVGMLLTRLHRRGFRHADFGTDS